MCIHCVNMSFINWLRALSRHSYLCPDFTGNKNQKGAKTDGRFGQRDGTSPRNGKAMTMPKRTRNLLRLSRVPSAIHSQQRAR